MKAVQNYLRLFIGNALMVSALALPFLAVPLVGHASETRIKAADIISIDQPYAFETTPKARVAAAYMQLTNHGLREVKILSATSPVASKVEIHSTLMVENLIRMRPLASGLLLTPDVPVQLEPGSYHLMLKGLTAALTSDETFDVDMQLSNGQVLTVNVQVIKRGHRPASKHDHSDHQHDDPDHEKQEHEHEHDQHHKDHKMKGSGTKDN